MLSLLLITCTLAVVSGRFTEEERVANWHAHHTWPPNWQPETENFRQLMEDRETEIMSLTGADERWENWMQYVTARLVPTFTEKGYQVITTPAHVHAKLHAAVMKGIAHWDDLPFEQGVDDSIYGSGSPKFVHLGNLATEVSPLSPPSSALSAVLVLLVSGELCMDGVVCGV